MNKKLKRLQRQLKKQDKALLYLSDWLVVLNHNYCNMLEQVEIDHKILHHLAKERGANFAHTDHNF